MLTLTYTYSAQKSRIFQAQQGFQKYKNRLLLESKYYYFLSIEQLSVNVLKKIQACVDK